MGRANRELQIILGVGRSGGLRDTSRISQHAGADQTPKLPAAALTSSTFFCPPPVTQGMHWDLLWQPRVLSVVKIVSKHFPLSN